MFNKLLLVAVLCLGLQACVPMFVAGAATTAAVYKRDSIKTMVQDENIAYQVRRRLGDDASIQNSNINVTCFNHVVLLTGQTPSPEMRQRIVQIAQGVENIAALYNEISIAEPLSFGQRADDSLLGTKVRASMIATKDLNSTDIKAVVEHGTVYLMGIVSQAQADLAVNAVRQVSGVKRVVKVFSQPAPTQYATNDDKH